MRPIPPSHRRAALTLLAPLLPLLVATPACDTVAERLGGSPEDRAEATDAVASLDLTAIEAALLTTFAEVTPLGSSPEGMAQAVSAAAPTLFSPASCVTAETLGASSTLTLRDCSGPRGLRSIRGIVNVVYTVEAASSVAITLTSTDLTTGRGNVLLNATGEYAMDSGKPRLSMITSGGGLATGSRPMTRAGTFVASWEGDCLLLDGQWTTTLELDLRATGVQGYKRCGAACPVSGTLAYATVDAATATTDPFQTSAMLILFRGRNTATFTSSRGTVGSLTLPCSP